MIRGMSLAPSKSINWYCGLVDRWKLFNKRQRQEKGPEMSFKMWTYNANIDLSGKNGVVKMD